MNTIITPAFLTLTLQPHIDQLSTDLSQEFHFMLDLTNGFVDTEASFNDIIEHHHLISNINSVLVRPGLHNLARKQRKNLMLERQF